MKQFIAEYVWVDGDGNLRSKARTIIITTENTIITKHDIPDWNYDGSSTKQATGEKSEIILKPWFLTTCPFRRFVTNNGPSNLLVLCDTYDSIGDPAINNHRHWANNIFNKKLDAKPWFGIEQEFFLMNKTSNKPVGYDSSLETNSQGQFYCSVGSQNAFGRKVIDEFYEHCLYAGINISGVNAEVAPGQWEYQIGPSVGITAGDELYLSRYIIQRIAEKYDFIIDFEPKPLIGNWNGSGCHTNYSTKYMREGTNKQTGLCYINDAIDKLALTHNIHMKLYGTGNELRMTGQHETSSYDTFTLGIGNRGASIRIPTQTVKKKEGYFEDRRPSSNMDPYLVTGILFQTTVIK
jgi:glutamine synthetase